MQDVIITRPLTFENPPKTVEELNALVAEIFRGTGHSAHFTKANMCGGWIGLHSDQLRLKGKFTLIDMTRVERDYPFFVIKPTENESCFSLLAALIIPIVGAKERGLVASSDFPLGRISDYDAFTLTHIDSQQAVRPLVINVRGDRREHMQKLVKTPDL